MKKQITYKDAGVDIARAESSLANLKERINATRTPEVLSGVGMFGGFYDLSAHGLREPVLVSSTDGVGTKLKVAMLADKHDTVGQDLVNHCINDIAVSGARPLFFLDYFASGRLEPAVYEAVVGGVAEGCRKAGVALIGGETAEMPDFYAPGDYDICGTIVGIVEKSEIIDGRTIASGDLLIGVSGNGLHTNGYTLARRVLLTEYEVHDQPAALDGLTVGEALLKIHPNYFSLIQSVRATAEIHGISHVTGGGIEKNTRRLLPEGLELHVDWDRWRLPKVFELIQSLGNVPEADMRQAFNMGIGLVFVVSKSATKSILNSISDSGFNGTVIGEIQ